MTLNQRLSLLLLLGLTITLVAASPCIVSEDNTRCVCNIQSIHHPDSRFCLFALELELRDSKLDRMDVAVDQEILQQIQINKLILNNDTISFSFISTVIPPLNSVLNEIHIISSTLEVTQLLLPPQMQVQSKITALLLEDVSVDPFLLQPSLEVLHQWLFSSLKSLHVVRSGLVEIKCYWAQRAANLNHLDLSENPISYAGLQNISTCLSLSFKSLKSLHLRRTNLTSLQSLCMPLSLAPAIQELDVSGNDFSIFDFPSCLQGKLLRTLDLSHSRITEVKSLLSASLEELDLSYNYLEIFDNPPQSLKKLCLSNNRLIRLPSLDDMSQLKELKVDGNRLTVLINDTDVNLSKLEQLDVLYAGRNPYQCDCSLKETVIFLDSADSVFVEDYPEDFLCASPAAQQGSQITKLSLESCVKPTSGTPRLRGSPLCLTLFVGDPVALLHIHMGMATVNINAPLCEGAETVRVGVVLTTVPEGKECVVIGEDGQSVHYKSGKDEETKSFPFDKVVTVDNIQSLHPELLRPLTESSACNGALVICGASTEKIRALIDHSIIKQVLANLFSHELSQLTEESFISVSCLQFYPDGSAVDLLSPSRQSLKLVKHPVLGSRQSIRGISLTDKTVKSATAFHILAGEGDPSDWLFGLVGGLCEVCVCSAEEAYTLYETCRETLKANTGTISSRCSSLFSVAAEWKLHPEQVDSEVCRSRLQLFSLAGGASRTDLRGVSPLVKVLDQTQCEATTSDKILQCFLNDALTGNSRTVLIYCIQPQGLLDDETPSALALAQKARSLVTRATGNRWRPRATEQEIRDKITQLRTRMMSQEEDEVQNTYRLAELTQNLQIVKKQSWEKRREESKKIKDKTQSRQTSNSNLCSSDCRESTYTVKYLQEQLKREMEEHIREGKGDVEKVQERVSRIQQLREALREETLKTGAAAEKSDLHQQSQLEYSKAQERRRQLKEDRGRLIQEEVEKMERDLAQELTEGPQRELLVLTRERQILVLQIEALRAEAQQAERDLQDQYHRHQTELHCLREESLQVFRAFRQVSEEQRKMSEGRYRSVLLEAVQDAVYLSAQNQQLQADNKQLRKALGELKDSLAVRGELKTEPLPQQQ